MIRHTTALRLLISLDPALAGRVSSTTAGLRLEFARQVARRSLRVLNARAGFISIEKAYSGKLFLDSDPFIAAATPARSADTDPARAR